MKKQPILTDRERILSLVIRELMTSALLCSRGNAHDEASWNDRGSGRQYAHFAYYRKPVKGDLVIGRTGMMMAPHRWSIGFYDSALPDGAVIREIGSKALCNYTNEEFTVIAGLAASELREGDQLVFQNNVQLAFQRGSEWNYRYGGVDFLENGEARIWIREAFGGIRRKSEPFFVDMKYGKRTSVKAILAAMRAGGYGTKEFAEKPAEVVK